MNKKRGKKKKRLFTERKKRASANEKDKRKCLS